MERFIEEGLIERISWLIRLRWIAILGVVLTALFVKKAVGISLPSFYLFFIAAIIAAYNIFFLLLVNHIKRKRAPNLSLSATGIANIQISLDLLCLTALIHFSGGIENPFIFYFIFHMIIASILLPRKESFLQATFVAVLFLLMISLEYFNFLNHYCLKGFVDFDLHKNKIYISGVSFVFISTLYLAVYMASSISVRLRQREKSLKEANLLLEEKDRIKSEYVLRVTHDIKEHLSAIQSCLQPITQGIIGPLSDKQFDLLQRADERAGKLMFFVRALLEITRIKLSKEIEMSRFSLKKTLESAVSFVEPKAKSKRIIIEQNFDSNVDMIWGAQIYIEETIANILANSVKYTPPDGKITLETKEEGDFILVSVSDTGIGVPQDEISRIFDEFYRARNAREIEKNGTGLGLSIAKQVVERHKGKIWLESAGEGKGSKFSFILPKNP